jgi:Domain of unknown function (DUF4416)
MLKTDLASQGLLFSSFLYREDLFQKENLIKFWEEKFGKSFALIPLNNPLNDYYQKEMGQGLKRIFFISAKSFPRDFLLSTKLQAISWENSWAYQGKRRVNVDIGLLTSENFLLATTKNYSHRIFIGQNIFADLTYFFHQGRLQTLPWTYPDYQDEEKKNFFSWSRYYLLQTRSI